MKLKTLMVALIGVAVFLISTTICAASGDLSVKGNAEVNGNMIVDGNTTTNGSAVVSGNLGVGTTTPGARLQVEGDALFLGVKNVDSVVSSYYVKPKRYQIEATKAVVGSTVPLDIYTVYDLCSDEDGCSITLGMRNFDSVNQPGNVASRGPYKFYITRGVSDKRRGIYFPSWWRLSNTDASGKDANNVVNHIIQAWDCVFTDGEYSNSVGTDFYFGLGLLNWNATYTDPNMVCLLTIDD